MRRSFARINPSQYWLLNFSIYVAFFVASGLVQAAPQKDSLANCRAIQDDRGRLICYDQLPDIRIAPLDGAADGEHINAEVLGPLGKTVAPVESLSDTADFGGESLPHLERGGPLNLTARAIGKIEGIRKGLIIKLDNGQVWQCLDEPRFRDYEAESPTITIERNIIGTYWLQFTGTGVRMRVRRVQ